MNTARFSRLACWPTNSASVCGRSDASAASSSRRSGETVRAVVAHGRAFRRCNAVMHADAARNTCPQRTPALPCVHLPLILLRQFLQAVADHRVEAGGFAKPLDHPRHDRLRLGPAIAEIDQRRERILGRAARQRRGVANRATTASRRPCPAVRSAAGPRAARRRRRARQAGPVAGGDGRDQIARRQCRQDRQRHRPPTPCTVVSSRNQSRSAGSAKP